MGYQIDLFPMCDYCNEGTCQSLVKDDLIIVGFKDIESFENKLRKDGWGIIDGDYKCVSCNSEDDKDLT